MKTFVEIHVLQNYAPSNLNRDDTGAPKDAFFGGCRRARISSQCQKRAVRVKDTIRTTRLQDELARILVTKGRGQEESMPRIELALKSVKLMVKEDGKTEYSVFLGKREIDGIANAIHDHWDSLMASDASLDEKKDKKKKKKGEEADGLPAELKNAIETAFDGGKAIGLALFGRMLADMPEKNRNAACQVAHAISTHAVDREFDFYTALDDLKPEGTAGSDMMGTVEFNSACFYRYAVVDHEKLIENLQKDKELALSGLRIFLENFVIAEPTGKQNSFAAHNPPEFVSISVRRETAPRNLLNAFEKAVRVSKVESLTKESAIRMAAKAKALDALYKTEPNSRYACAEDTFGDKFEVVGLGEKLPSIPDVIEWALKELKTKGV
jgi:CRISPR system Cascade subunit CasC